MWIVLYKQFCEVAENCAGRFLRHSERCCTALAKARRLQTQTCEEIEQSTVAWWRYTGEDTPAQPLVETDGLWVCAVQRADQADDVVFLPLPSCCSTVSQVYKRQEENVFNHLMISFLAIAQDNEDNNNNNVLLSCAHQRPERSHDT